MHFNIQKNKKPKSGGKTLDTEGYVLIMKKIGFSVAELEWFDVGNILDIAIEYVKQDGDEIENEATQEDFDMF